MGNKTKGGVINGVNISDEQKITDWNKKMISGTFKIKKNEIIIGKGIAEYFDNKISIIDFKTSAKPKERKWIENYFIQETAYAKMFEELTGKEVHSIITMIAVSNGTSQIFFEEPSEKYTEKLFELRDQYRNEYGI